MTMNPIESLHTAARHYCIDRSTTLRGMYRSVDSSKSERQSLDHKDAFLETMLTDTESFTPAEFGSLEEVQNVLFQVGRDDSMAEEAPWKRFPKRISDEERGLYQEYLTRLTAQADWVGSVEPLPYRRTLGKQESKSLWDQLEERWQVTGGYWYPEELIEAVPPQVAVFAANAFEDEVPPEVLRDILAQRGIERVFTLFEFAGENEYEIDVSLLVASYGSSGELYCTSRAMDWLIYASHENAITFAGEWLIEAVQAAWENWPCHIWRMSDLGQ